MYETARAGRGRRGQSAMTFIKFGARVRGKRRELGYTQAKLAELCEVSIPFIGHIERGTRAPSLESLLTLCNVLRVTPNYLLQDYLKIPNVDLSSEVISTADLYALDKISRILHEAGQVVLELTPVERDVEDYFVELMDAGERPAAGER